MIKLSLIITGVGSGLEAKVKRGYGQFNNGTRKPVRAHKWSYNLFVGEVPHGLELDHLC